MPTPVLGLFSWFLRQLAVHLPLPCYRRDDPVSPAAPLALARAVSLRMTRRCSTFIFLPIFIVVVVVVCTLTRNTFPCARQGVRTAKLCRFASSG